MSHLGYPSPAVAVPQIDESRYQTIGRGHGFSEISGVPFKIADKYRKETKDFADFMTQLAELTMATQETNREISLYSFELERKVLENMNVMNGV